MKRLLIALSALFFTSVFVVDDAEARRVGGGRSAGAQRQALPEKPTRRLPQRSKPPRPSRRAPQRPRSR